MAKFNDNQKIEKLKKENLELKQRVIFLEQKIISLENSLGLKKEKLVLARENLKNKREKNKQSKIKELKKILISGVEINKTNLALKLNISRVTLNRYLEYIKTN